MSEAPGGFGGMAPRDDHYYAINHGVDLSFRSLTSRVSSDAVLPLAKSFVSNLNRLTSLWALPIDGIYWGSVIGQMHNIAYKAVFSLGQPNEDSCYIDVPIAGSNIVESVRIDRIIHYAALPPEDRHRIRQVRDAIFDVWLKQVEGHDDAKLKNASWTMGGNFFEKLAEMQWEISEGLGAALESITQGVW